MSDNTTAEGALATLSADSDMIYAAWLEAGEPHGITTFAAGWQAALATGADSGQGREIEALIRAISSLGAVGDYLGETTILRASAIEMVERFRNGMAPFDRCVATNATVAVTPIAAPEDTSQRQSSNG